MADLFRVMKLFGYLALYFHFNFPAHLRRAE